MHRPKTFCEPDDDGSVPAVREIYPFNFAGRVPPSTPMAPALKAVVDRAVGRVERAMDPMRVGQ